VAIEYSGTFLSRVGRNVPGNMAALIDALINYQKGAGPRIDELYIISKECDHWLKKHVSSYFASKQNLREEAGVRHMLGEVFDELDRQSNGLGQALSDYRIKKAQGVKGKSFTSLGKGYHLERKTYEEMGKQSAPFSGSKVRDYLDDNHQDIDFHGINSGTFNKVGQHLNVKMYFLNKVNRLKKLVTCVQHTPNQTRWFDIEGNLVHTPHDPAFKKGHPMTCGIYAMDRYGNLFTELDNYNYGTHVMGLTKGAESAAMNLRGQTNHSSICAGREVICAGNIFFWKGQLLHIDNSSGHYAPNKAALHKAVQLLLDAGTNPDYLRVGLFQPKSFFKARTFLRNGVADWPNQDETADAHDQIYQLIPGFVT
jgi:hypothetical protein